MNNGLIFGGIVAILVLNGVFLFIILKALKGKQEEKKDDAGLSLLLQQMNELNRTVDQKIGEGSKQMSDSVRHQFGESQKLVTDIRDLVHKQLNEVAKGVAESKESTRQVFGLAEQLQNLEKVLKNQKQRGNLGEASLELVLSNVLSPNDYKMQYDFPNGETVDAAIFTKEGIIPVDAKFSLDNYSRLINASDDREKEELQTLFRNDLKLRIDECAKYVRPKDGTLPFALMYIPAEGIYYDLLVNDIGSKTNARSLIDYASNEKKVIIVSPTTFSAYLHAILYGFKAFKIEKDALDIKKNIESLSRHLTSYESFFKKVGSSLTTTVSHYTSAYKELGKVDKDIMRVSGDSPGFEALLVSKPDMLEE